MKRDMKTSVADINRDKGAELFGMSQILRLLATVQGVSKVQISDDKE